MSSGKLGHIYNRAMRRTIYAAVGELANADYTPYA
jgi:hypothetical protein